MTWLQKIRLIKEDKVLSSAQPHVGDVMQSNSFLLEFVFSSL